MEIRRRPIMEYLFGTPRKVSFTSLAEYAEKIGEIHETGSVLTCAMIPEEVRLVIPPRQPLLSLEGILQSKDRTLSILLSITGEVGKQIYTPPHHTLREFSLYGVHITYDDNREQRLVAINTFYMLA
ncbi:MAG: hypothetical protein KC548_00555 [Nanoarchaeota archaeon]|nr:hypothetical protein [Nanoarchaeota archaeon]